MEMLHCAMQNLYELFAQNQINGILVLQSL